MNAEAGRLEWLWRGLFTLVALAAPGLAGYVAYFQCRLAVVDFTFDEQTGLIDKVPIDSYANWAGLWPGDVIVAVDGVPFDEWLNPEIGIAMFKLDRNGQSLLLEVPVLPLARLNRLPLISAIAVAAVFWGVGILLLWRQSRRADVRLFFLLAQVFAAAALLLLSQPGYWSSPRWTMLLCIACFHIAAPMLVHHLTTFPVTLGAPRQRRWGLGLLYGLALVSIAGALSSNSLWIRGSVLYTTLEIGVAVGILAYVYTRRATPDDRRRLRLIVFGNVLAAVPPMLFYLLPAVAGLPYRMPGWAMGLFLILAPLSYVYAVMRHSLFGIDRLLNRALVYGLLSLGILLLYLGPFLLLYRLTPGDRLAEILVAAGLTLLVGLAFDWSRRGVQRLVDRVFYGGWYDYPGVVETVSAALARTLNRAQLADVLTRQAPEMMQLRPGRLWIGEPDETLPQRAPGSHLQFVFPLAGRRLAVWIVAPRRDGEDVTESDYRILKTLADQAEIALNNVLLVETLHRQLDELRAGRKTLTQAQRQLLRSREEERARLARDLHDGPIQLLVGLNMQLGLLLTPVEGGSSSSVEELQAMRAEVRELLAELRQVCTELRPPMLDALGLGAALRALAYDWSAQNGVEVHLELPTDATLRPLPEEVAVNLYRVVQEALTNVARHADARQINIQLAWTPPDLTLTVQDDGRGFAVPETLHPLTEEGHFGLMGMQERIALIGGTWAVESTPGQGTTIRATWQRRE